MAGAAIVFVSQNGNIAQLQCIRTLTGSLCGQRAVGEIAALDILRSHARVRVRLSRRLHDQILQSAVPSLAEFGAAHANDGNLVFHITHNHTLLLLVLIVADRTEFPIAASSSAVHW